jgi:hypothetical protein
MLQDAANASSFTAIGSLPAGFVAAFGGASFVSLSPDGSTLAVGNGAFGANAAVGLLPFASLSAMAPSPVSAVAMNNFTGRWFDNSTLLVTGADGPESFVAAVDRSTKSRRNIVSNIGGSVGGVAFNSTHLLTSNGFDFDDSSGSQTGEVRATPLVAALAGATPVDFENDMTPVAKLLSGSDLGFDGMGNLLVGGGDVFSFPPGDFGYAGVVDGAAIAAALGGSSPAGASLALLPPGVPANASTSLRFNPATGELLFTLFDNNTFSPSDTVYRYAIPTPSLPASCLLLSILLAARRQRRRDLPLACCGARSAEHDR